jgi:hypothetical protein
VKENKSAEIDVLMGVAEMTFNAYGSLSHRTPEVGSRTPETGAGCNCPTIKNYPTEPDKKNKDRQVKKFSITPGALRAFRPESLDPTEDPDDDNDDDE